MTWEESLKILSSYKFAYNRSQQLLEKIHTMEVKIYNAQAGYVENEEGVKVSGGNHITRAENIADLVDLKDKWGNDYDAAELRCRNIYMLIQNIFTNNPEAQANADSKLSSKLARYENVLISYYINNKSISEVAEEIGFYWRHVQRYLNEARRVFFEMYEENTYNIIESFLSGNAFIESIKCSKSEKNMKKM